MPYKHFILDIQALGCWKGCLAFGWGSQFWVEVANFLDVMSDEQQGGQRATIMSVMRDQRITKSCKERRRATIKALPTSTQPPSPLQNLGLALTHQFALFCFSDGSVITDALLLCRAEMNLLDCCASPLIIKLGAKPKMTAAIR
jgi:hypothetical protein